MPLAESDTKKICRTLGLKRTGQQFEFKPLDANEANAGKCSALFGQRTVFFNDSNQKMSEVKNLVAPSTVASWSIGAIMRPENRSPPPIALHFRVK